MRLEYSIAIGISDCNVKCIKFDSKLKNGIESKRSVGNKYLFLKLLNRGVGFKTQNSGD